MKALAILVLIALLFPVSGALADPKISYPTITPRIADTDTDYAFTLRYIGEMAPESVNVIVDGQVYPMEEVDPSDVNYTNGKDYSLVTGFPAGSHICYFKVTANGTVLRSATYTIIVEESAFGFEHLDIVLAVGIVGIVFIIPIIYITIIFRRMSRDLGELVSARNSKESSDDGSGFSDGTFEEPDAEK